MNIPFHFTEMTIFVENNNLSGNTTPLEMKKSDTIELIMEKIKEKGIVPSDQSLKLFFNGRELESGGCNTYEIVFGASCQPDSMFSFGPEIEEMGIFESNTLSYHNIGNGATLQLVSLPTGG